MEFREENRWSKVKTKQKAQPTHILFTASLFTHAKEKASEASAKHAGVVGDLGPHPLLS